MKNILFHLKVAFAANLFLLSLIIGIRSLAPVESIYITTQDNGIVLSGKTILGMNQIKIFSQWNELQSYMNFHGISLIQANEASLEAYPFSRIEKNESYKIFKTKDDQSILLMAPDLKSAQVIKNNLLFGNISTGPFGFSLKAENKRYEKITQLLQKSVSFL